uniref:equilibrative nucleotide transporter 3-like isoform X2 n=1 Tax=Erigeron canadensis TaxID=72917 RepID=UPI001CB97C2D|nr:equilibrative nucleotide transporter 3-like isoform X2 [Erigeron canadensis]
MVHDSSDLEIPMKLQGKWSAMAMCWLFGLGTLLSWNIVSTIGDYFYELFPNYHPARVLTLVYLPFSLATISIFLYHQSRIDTRKRNITGYILFFASNFSLLVLDLATSGNGGIWKYIGMCILIAISGIADAHVQGGMIGDLALMCPEFIQSFVAGLAASGALTSILRLTTKAAFENVENGLRTGALVFLAISTLFEFLCIILYAFFFPNLPIVKYYRAKAAREGSKTVSSDLSAVGIQMEFDQHVENDAKPSKRLSIKQLFLENFDYTMDLFLICVVTLSIFPGFLYENTGSHQLGTWYPLVLVTTYNVSNLISRYIPLIQYLKLESRKGLVIFVLSRFLLIPAFYFTSKYGDQGWMIALVFILGSTTGYPTVCVMTLAPRIYKGPEKNALGNLLVLSLQSGILIGVALDWLWIIGNGNF